MTAGAPRANSDLIQVSVPVSPRPLTRAQMTAVAITATPAALAVLVIGVGGPFSIAVLMLMLEGFLAPLAVTLHRRPIGVLRFRVADGSVEFAESAVLHNAVRRCSPLLLLGPLEGLRLIVTGASGDLPVLTQLALWFGLPAFFGLRREMGTWGVARTSLRREGVLATDGAGDVLHRWADLRPPDDRPHPLRRVLAAPPKRKVFSDGFLGSDPDLVARVIEFYRENPGARPELGTPAAVERLQRFDFPART